MRALPFVFLLATAQCGFAAQDLTLPEWLNADTNATDRRNTASASSVDASYITTTAASNVVEHYKAQLKAAGVIYQASFDGIGTSISGSRGAESCIIRVREIDGGSQVKIGYAVNVPSDSSATAVPVTTALPVSTFPESPFHVSKTRHLIASDVTDWATPPLRPDWPQWLGPPPNGSQISGQEPVDRAKLNATLQTGEYVRRVFHTSDEIHDVYQYYSAFLKSHGYFISRGGMDNWVEVFSQKNLGHLTGSLEAYQHPVKNAVSDPSSPFPDMPNSHYERRILIGLTKDHGTTVTVTFGVKNGA